MPLVRYAGGVAWRTLLPWWRVPERVSPWRSLAVGCVTMALGAFTDWRFLLLPGGLSLMIGAVEIWRSRRPK